MDWVQAPDYWLSRLVIERGLAALYLIAFVVAFNQFRPLLGERGLLPAPDFLRLAPFSRTPSLFHLHYSDRMLAIVAVTGAVLAAAAVLGLVEAAPLWAFILAWFALWALYLSIVNVGQIFYGFGWESLLLEAGFLAIFLGPSSVAPPTAVLWMIRWLLFRVEFGAGLIKLRGDTCWRDLTCLYYHHETQPMPNPLSWFFHNLPRPLHRAEVLGNHVAQLVVPFGLFAPQPLSSVAAVIIVLTQAWLVLSGNFSWLNAITMVLAFSSLDGSALQAVLPLRPPALASLPPWFLVILGALTLLVLLLSYRPALNLVSRRQLMNFSFNPFHLVNAYGAFGSITRVRREIVIEGTRETRLGPSTAWKAYEFKGKPGDPGRLPPQVAPYHLRLDWPMWFAGMSSPAGHPWFTPLLARLLHNDRPTLKLLRRNPFPDAPPVFVRARLSLYRFSPLSARPAVGAWWIRELVGDYLPPVRLGSES